MKPVFILYPEGGDGMDEFESLLENERISVKRYIRFRVNDPTEADDILQDVCLTAFQKFSALREKESFKAWLITIARNKVNDYFRKKAVCYEIPIDRLKEARLADARHGVSVISTVRETLSLLGDQDKQIIWLFYWKEMPQSEIAKKLNIPVGTVKSRLHTARNNFRENYPYRYSTMKGADTMKQLPEYLPEYRIDPDSREPFDVKWEELMGWFLVPKPGEKISWGMYDMPSRKCSHIYDMEVTGKAKVHGIEGVELTAREAPYSSKKEVINRTFVAQLTDTHCRYLATLRTDGDVRNYITFLDGEEFMECWGFGEDNCGNETNLTRKGDIQRNGNTVTSSPKDFLLDIVGRYAVTINGKTYDTVCVMDIETYNSGVVSEQFLDQNGLTILWRRFNRDDWAIDHYKKPWSEQLPDNDRITVNGITYVQWYDCITDYIL